MIDLANLDVVPHPHPALRWMAKPIPKVIPIVQDVAKRMIELMHDYRGSGLAATQVAVPWRLFVTCVNDRELVFINPEIHLGRNKRDKNPRIAWDFEACLSFPGLHLEEKIPRAHDVYVEALDINGKPFTTSAAGMFARVVQHENDHLNGVLFLDHMKLTGIVHMQDHIETFKEYADGWCQYLEAQYRFLDPHPKYGTDEEAKERLLALEKYLEEQTSETPAQTLEKVGGEASPAS
jgi:peptide deformylase